MRRRRFLISAGALFILETAAARAQPEARVRRIGLLHPGSRQSNRETFDAFRAALKELGYREGRDLAIEARWADGRLDRLAPLAAELVAGRPAVLVAATSAAVAVCMKATASIPIVFATASSPVEQGFVSSLRRPGGNVTGVVLYSGDLAAKNIELAREAFPRMRRLAILVHEPDPVHRLILEQFLPNARRLDIEPVVVRIAGAGDLDRAFRDLTAAKAEAVYLPEQNFMVSQRREVAARGLQARLPVLSNNEDITVAGALMSYGTARAENYRRAAAMVDKILRGAKPAEMPVEQPERFQLVFNRRTANAIGAMIEPTILQRADRIVD